MGTHPHELRSDHCAIAFSAAPTAVQILAGQKKARWFERRLALVSTVNCAQAEQTQQDGRRERDS